MDRVRLKNDIAHWIKFFLEATIDTAQSAKIKFKKVVELIEEYKKRALNFSGKPANHLAILEIFYDDPFQYGKKIHDKTGISQATVDKSIRQLIDSEIIQEVTGNSRNRVFLLHKYFSIFARL